MIEAELYTHLSTNVTSVSGRVYPQIMSQGCAKPALVYTIINDRDECGASGCVAASVARIQIDVYATDDLLARQIRDEVKSALYSFAYHPIDLNTMDGFVEETELSRQIIDFKIRR